MAYMSRLVQEVVRPRSDDSAHVSLESPNRRSNKALLRSSGGNSAFKNIDKRPEAVDVTVRCSEDSLSSSSASPPFKPAAISRSGSARQLPTCPVQSCADLLLQRYLHYSQSLDKQMKQAGGEFDKPKGALTKAFLLLCVPTDLADLRDMAKTALTFTQAVAPFGLPVTVLLAPIWLWAVRSLARASYTMAATVLFALGAMFFLLLSQLASNDAESDENSIITASNLHIQQPKASSALQSNSLQQKSQAYGAAAQSKQPSAASGDASRSSHRAPNGLPAAYQGKATAKASTTPYATNQAAASVLATSSTATAGISSSTAAAAAAVLSNRTKQPVAAAPSRYKDDPVMKELRARIIKLEFHVFGNELTEGLLPMDVLPTRVQQLCEQVGVEWSPTTKSFDEMNRLLMEVESILGV